MQHQLMHGTTEPVRRNGPALRIFGITSVGAHFLTPPFWPSRGYPLTLAHRREPAPNPAIHKGYFYFVMRINMRARTAPNGACTGKPPASELSSWRSASRRHLGHSGRERPNTLAQPAIGIRLALERNHCRSGPRVHIMLERDAAGRLLPRSKGTGFNRAKYSDASFSQ